MRQMQSNRRKKKRSAKKQRQQQPTRSDQSPGNEKNVIEEKDPKKPDASLLTHAVRAAGILPLLALICVLVTHHPYQNHIPQWFHPVLDDQVAVLTLCAGHAGVVGIWLTRRTDQPWATYALLIAAGATAGAGYRAIGDNLAGQVVALLLFALFVPAAWAERISAVLSRLWRFFRYQKGWLIVVGIITAGTIIYNQSQNENYFRNWILIPIGILLGFAVTVALLWMAFRLSIRFWPAVWAWFKKALSKARGKIWNKQR